jgi:hypothetical protein
MLTTLSLYIYIYIFFVGLSEENWIKYQLNDLGISEDLDSCSLVLILQ